MHMKAIPGLEHVGEFAGKHKIALIAGAAILVGGGYLAMRGQASAQPASGDVQTLPVVSSIAPGSFGGGGSVVGGGDLSPSNNGSAPTVTFQGAYGSYDGLTGAQGAAFDLSRLQMEQGQQTVVYQQTIDANAVIAALNLDAYGEGLGYGANAANTNTNFLSQYVQNTGVTDPNAIAYLANVLFGNNPVTPGVAYNGPAYYGVNGSTVGNSTIGGQNLNQPQQPYSPPSAYTGPTSYTPPTPTAPAAPVSHTMSISEYLAANPDLAREASHVVDPAHANQGAFSTVADYLSWHDANYAGEVAVRGTWA
jgi:hypothetical protein